MAWVYLLCAAACEMVWPLGFKYTNGFRDHTWAVIGTFAIMGVSFWLLSIAINHGIPIGNAYAVWTGIGACGTAIIGMILFNEPREALRLTCVGLIILGAVGLKLVTPPARPAAQSTHAPPPVPPAEENA